MNRIARLTLGTAVMTIVIGAVAVLSAWPSYRALPEGYGVVRLSFTHGGERTCRDRSAAELEKLPANMRRTQVCDRIRSPVYVELDLDGETVYRASLAPSGIASDGPSRVYQRFVLPSGIHDIAVRLRDTGRSEGFDHVADHQVSLDDAQSFTIDFRPVAGGFVFN